MSGEIPTYRHQMVNYREGGGGEGGGQGQGRGYPDSVCVNSTARAHWQFVAQVSPDEA